MMSALFVVVFFVGFLFFGVATLFAFLGAMFVGFCVPVVVGAQFAILGVHVGFDGWL